MDDLPAVAVRSTGAGSGPMYSPYHRFWFTSTFKVAPEARFKPSSGKSMLQFTPSDHPSAAQQARFGNQPGQANDCFSFDFSGANLGCESEQAACIFTFTGMVLDAKSKKEEKVISRTVEVPACPATKDCKLQHVSVEGFKALSSVVVDVKVDNEDRTWYADDLELGWSDNACDKARCRSQMRNTILTKSAGRRWIA